jgi:hypothetical protein
VCRRVICETCGAASATRCSIPVMGIMARSDPRIDSRRRHPISRANRNAGGPARTRGNKAGCLHGKHHMQAKQAVPLPWRPNQRARRRRIIGKRVSRGSGLGGTGRQTCTDAATSVGRDASPRLSRILRTPGSHHGPNLGLERRFRHQYRGASRTLAMQVTDTQLATRQPQTVPAPAFAQARCRRPAWVLSVRNIAA